MGPTRAPILALCECREDVHLPIGPDPDNPGRLQRSLGALRATVAGATCFPGGGTGSNLEPASRADCWGAATGLFPHCPAFTML